MKNGSLVVVGSGIKSVGHLTIETLRKLRRELNRAGFSRRSDFLCLSVEMCPPFGASCRVNLAPRHTGDLALCQRPAEIGTARPRSCIPYPS